MQNSSGIAEIGQELAYDLRQTYAKIVGDHLEDIAQARKSDNYSIYFKNLKDLYVIVRHKFKKKSEPEDDDQKNKGKSDDEIYAELMKKAVELANQYPQDFLGQAKDPQACAEIEMALNDIEMFLYKKIDKAKMFGGSGHTPGL